MEKFRISFKDNIELKYIEKDTFIDIHNDIRLVCNEITDKVTIKLDIVSLNNRLCHYIREYICGIVHYANITVVELSIPKKEIKFNI